MAIEDRLRFIAKSPQTGQEEYLDLGRHPKRRDIKLIASTDGEKYIPTGSVADNNVARIVFEKKDFPGLTKERVVVVALEFYRNNSEIGYESTDVSDNHNQGERLVLMSLKDTHLENATGQNWTRVDGRKQYTLVYKGDVKKEFNKQYKQRFKMQLAGETEPCRFVCVPEGDTEGKYQLRSREREIKQGSGIKKAIDYALINTQDENEVYLMSNVAFSRITDKVDRVEKTDSSTGAISSVKYPISLLEAQTEFTKFIRRNPEGKEPTGAIGK